MPAVIGPTRRHIHSNSDEDYCTICHSHDCPNCGYWWLCRAEEESNEHVGCPVCIQGFTPSNCFGCLSCGAAVGIPFLRGIRKICDLCRDARGMISLSEATSRVLNSSNPTTPCSCNRCRHEVRGEA